MTHKIEEKVTEDERGGEEIKRMAGRERMAGRMRGWQGE